jgi:uncharacterized protein YbaP (TraB family)
MMMKRISLILAIVLVALSSQAQLLWKVSGNGLGRPSYILGTFHFAPGSMIDKIPGMEQAIAGCDVVVGELENEAMKSIDLQALVTQAMMAPTDSTLDKLYSREDYRLIETVFNKYFGTMGVKLSQMNILKPMALNTQMQAMQAIKYFPNLDTNSLIDVAVQDRANKAGRPSLGLETAQEQIDLLYNAPLKEQAEGLLDACKKDDLFTIQSSAMVEAYLAQDLSKIWTIMTDPELGGDDEQAMDKLIYSRNRNWIEKLVAIMPERACLVCVGAGHLPGSQGLLQLLRDRGYNVEPMQ